MTGPYSIHELSCQLCQEANNPLHLVPVLGPSPSTGQHHTVPSFPHGMIWSTLRCHAIISCQRTLEIRVSSFELVPSSWLARSKWLAWEDPGLYRFFLLKESWPFQATPTVSCAFSLHLYFSGVSIAFQCRCLDPVTRSQL